MRLPLPTPTRMPSRSFKSCTSCVSSRTNRKYCTSACGSTKAHCARRCSPAAGSSLRRSLVPLSSSCPTHTHFLHDIHAQLAVIFYLAFRCPGRPARSRAPTIRNVTAFLQLHDLIAQDGGLLKLQLLR